MGRLLSRSSLLTWGYRLALIIAVFGFLASMEVVYVDLLDGKLDRVTGGAALALSSIVLAVSAILGRRLRRRSKELAARLTKLESTDRKIVKYMLALPASLQEKLDHRIDAQFHEGLKALYDQLVDTQHAASPLTAAVSDQSGAQARNERRVLRRAIELLGTAMVLNGEPEKRLRQAQECSELADHLQVMGQDVLAQNLLDRIRDVQNQIQGDLRQGFVNSLREQKWLAALQTGQQIRDLFPDSAMARDFGLLEPRIARKIQQQIDARTRPQVDISQPAKLQEQFDDTELAELGAALSRN